LKYFIAFFYVFGGGDSNCRPSEIESVLLPQDHHGPYEIRGHVLKI
jgi:hypothetical protein